MVYQYCFDVKPFNLAACSIMKCDMKCYDYVHQNGRPLTAVYNNVQALVMFSWHTTSVLIGKKSFICICGRRAKLNGKSETVAHVSAMGRQWPCTHKYIFIDVW